MNNPQLLDHFRLVIKSLLSRRNYTANIPKSQLFQYSWDLYVYLYKGVKADTSVRMSIYYKRDLSDWLT